MRFFSSRPNLRATTQRSIAANVAWIDQDSAVTTSGTTVDITGIAGLNEIHISLAGLSQDTVNTEVLLQIGDSGGIETSGYVCKLASTNFAETIRTSTAGFLLTDNVNMDAADVLEGSIKLIHFGSNVWGFSSYSNVLAAVATFIGAGTKTLSGVLTQIRLTTVAASAEFDAGTMYLAAR